MLYEHKNKVIGVIITLIGLLIIMMFVVPAIPKEQQVYGISSLTSYELDEELYIQFIQKEINSQDNEITYYLKSTEGNQTIEIRNVMSDEDNIFNKAVIINPNELDLDRIYEIYISNGIDDRPILQAKTYDEVVDVSIYRFIIGGTETLLLQKQSSDAQNTSMFDYKIVDEYLRDDLEIGYFSIAVKNQFNIVLLVNDEDVEIERLNKKRVGSEETKYFFAKTGKYEKKIEAELFLLTDEENQKFRDNTLSLDSIEKKYEIEI
jgi:hypothetical protein